MFSCVPRVLLVDLFRNWRLTALSNWQFSTWVVHSFKIVCVVMILYRNVGQYVKLCTWGISLMLELFPLTKSKFENFNLDVVATSINVDKNIHKHVL